MPTVSMMVLAGSAAAARGARAIRSSSRRDSRSPRAPFSFFEVWGFAARRPQPERGIIGNKLRACRDLSRRLLVARRISIQRLPAEVVRFACGAGIGARPHVGHVNATELGAEALDLAYAASERDVPHELDDAPFVV